MAQWAQPNQLVAHLDSSASTQHHTTTAPLSNPSDRQFSLSSNTRNKQRPVSAPHRSFFTFQLRSTLGLVFPLSPVKLDRHRGDRYVSNQDGPGYRQSRGPSRFSSDGPMTHHSGRRGSSPSSFRVSVGSGDSRPYESPPRQGPRGGGGFRPIGGRDGGGDGFGPMGGGERGYERNYEAPPPVSGQKRGFPFPGRGGASPDNSDGPKFAKLFVGSVPSTITEEDIRPLFEEHGHVIEVALIKDRRTGQQRGCCFIKYSTSGEADRAIRALHNQYTLPGAAGPIQVRYADGERERLGATEFKLFVGSLNKQATEQEVEEIFVPYGRVEDVYLMRDDMRQSRGCGFVKYANREMAMAAINALNGIYTMRGCDQPLTVRFADPKRPRPGDSRGGPTFGGPGFGPRFQSPGARPPPNFNEPSGDMGPYGAWKPTGMQDQAPPSDTDSRGMPRSSGMSAPSNPNAPVPALGDPTNSPLPAPMAPYSSMQQQSFNPPFQQFPPMNQQQVSPSQKPLQSPTMNLQPQQTPYSQAQSSLAQVGPRGGPLQSPNFPTTFSQPLPGQPLMGPGGAQAAPSSAIALQAPPSINMPSQARPSLPNQPHQVFPPTQTQQFPQQPQPSVQSPSPLAQMLTQQTQALRASFQSSQQAFSQLQQQLQMMQPSSQSIPPHQQGSQPANQQWPDNTAKTTTSTSTATQAVEVPPSSAAAAGGGAPVVPVNTSTVGLGKCSWTEHTSPDGFKYYYNSVTGESRWIEPDELKMFKQQQQQFMQQKPLGHQGQVLPRPYQVLSAQAQQPQMQPQPQMQFAQQPLQQHQFTSSYQASGAPSHQNVQEQGYPPYQSAAQPSNNTARFQQGVQASQDWMWKNKQPPAPEELS